jgi:FAD/FMN-containing dehydrogenase
MFNATIDRHPALIAQCRDTAEVVAATRLAADAGLPIAIRGGGHSVAGHSVADGALVIDLRQMRGVTMDPATVTVQGGALWQDVDPVTVAAGRGFPGGTFVDTGVGGLTLGGGIGWLMPLAGFTCDNLVGAEVVTADGTVVTAGPDGDPDLLWGLRGGGGNFGVVTSFTFRHIPIGPMFGGVVRFPASAARLVWHRVEDILGEWPTALLPTLTAHRDPDLGATVSFLVGIVDGSDAEAIARVLRRDLPTIEDDLRPRTYLDLQALAGELPFGLRHYWKGHFLRALDEDLFLALVGAALEPDAPPDAFLLLEGIVGAGRVEPEGGAAFGQRAARWNASAIAIWESEADDERGIRWARRTTDLMNPASLTGAGYVNYSPVDESADRVRAAYGDERWRRLVAVKRRYDPGNVFRFNHNIQPA